MANPNIIGTKVSKRLERVIAEGFKKYKPALRCAVCGESRCVELAHIRPVSMGGSSQIHNLMPLCPNHHYLFDNGKLTTQEYNEIAERVEKAREIELRIANAQFDRGNP
jgi:ArsR family metal-binding transcriptional regulator